jgi:hypothetical protein
MDRARLVAVAVVLAVVSAAAGAGFVALTTARSWFPASWDPRVAPIAAEVAQLRGLDFVHPVSVNYLAAKEFERTVASEGARSPAAEAEMRREEGVFRALGLLGGKDDLVSANDTADSSAILAYYDPAKQEVFVRGTTLDVAHRVTIAHELTHVLQDQHFDLAKLQRFAARTGEADSLRAVVEGDARRIEQDYLKQQSAADRKEYERENDAEADRVRKETASVPDIVGVIGAAPYELGSASVRVLAESGGNETVNDALTGAPPSSSFLVATGDDSPPVPVDGPLPPAGAARVGAPEAFGAFETFLTLATRIDPVRALAAADVVAGGTATTFRSDGEICYRVVVTPSSDERRAVLSRAVAAWAQGRDRTAVDDAGDDVGFTACDPGTAAPEPSPAPLRNAVALLELRTGLTVAAARGHRSGDAARCFARVFVQTPGAAQLLLQIGDAAPDPAQRVRLSDIAARSRAACSSDPEAGLS